MSKSVLALGCFLFLLAPARAQEDGYFELSTLPWNGDWLSLARDQMVHGEEYKGYPGPLPKLFAALGQDADHLGIDFELRFNVDRDAPTWYGQCDGLAAAAVSHPQPTPLIVHGVKFFPAELKALLTGIHKDGLRLIQGGQGPFGLSPDAMEFILFQSVARDAPIIFDVDISEEIWNFPVAAFSRSSSVSGDWTQVTLDVGYTATLLMDDYQGPPQFSFTQYTYQYLTATQNQYQWTGASMTDHPQLAWFPGPAYSPEIWQLFANRYYNLTTLDQMQTISNQPNADKDWYEPNDTINQATQLQPQLLLASLPSGDIDVYRFSAVAGEPVVFDLTVYDGESIDVTLTETSGQVVETQDLVRQVHVDFLAEETTVYTLTLSAHPDATLTAFYQVVFPEDRGFFRGRQEVEGVGPRQVRVMDLGHDGNAVLSEMRRDLARNGSMDLGPVVEDTRSLEQVMWVSRRTTDQGVDKTYAWDHELKMAVVVPHMTFRNDWDTRLDIRVDAPQPQVTARVFSRTGMLLETVELPLDENGAFSGSLADWLGQSAVRNGAWFALDAGGGRIEGVVEFCRPRLGDFSRMPIESKPLVGDMVVFDLLDRFSGWNGLALVNTSGLDNELMFRLRNPQGTLVDEGSMILEPGQKLLTTVADLAMPVGRNDILELFSQYEVEALTIRHEYASGETWGHRVLAYFSDAFNETFMSVDDWDEVTLVCMNPNRQNVHLLFEGYAADGSLQGRFHTVLGKAIKPFETRRASVSQIMENGVELVDLEAITHFRMTALEPLYAVELISARVGASKTVARLIPVYDDP